MRFLPRIILVILLLFLSSFVISSKALAIAHITQPSQSLSIAPSDFNTSNWSFSAWIQDDNPNAGSDGSISMQVGDACVFWDMGFGTNPNGTLRLETSPANQNIVLGTTPIDTQEHLYTVVYNGTNLIAYRDGAAELTLTPSNPVTLTHPISLGNYNSQCDSSVLGTYRDARWWNTALSGADVSNLFAGVVPQLSSLVAYWPLNADANDTVGSHNLINNGAVTFSQAPTPTPTPTINPNNICGICPNGQHAMYGYGAGVCNNVGPNSPAAIYCSFDPNGTACLQPAPQPPNCISPTPTPTPTPGPDQAPVITSIPGEQIPVGGTFGSNSQQTIFGAFSDPDSTSWTATLDYGDGSTPNTFAASPNSTISMSHIYNVPGRFTVTLSITDNQGQTGVQKTYVLVGNVCLICPSGSQLSGQQAQWGINYPGQACQAVGVGQPAAVYCDNASNFHDCATPAGTDPNYCPASNVSSTPTPTPTPSPTVPVSTPTPTPTLPMCGICPDGSQRAGQSAIYGYLNGVCTTFNSGDPQALYCSSDGVNCSYPLPQYPACTVPNICPNPSSTPTPTVSESPTPTVTITPTPLAASCSVNIFPQPTPGTHTYTVRVTNNTSTPGYYFLNNFWTDGSPSGNPSNVSLLSNNQWAMSTGLGYSVSGTAGTPIAQGDSVVYQTDLTFNNSFDGIDLALRSQGSSTNDICDMPHGTYAITYENISVTPTPTPTPTPAESCDGTISPTTLVLDQPNTLNVTFTPHGFNGFGVGLNDFSGENVLSNFFDSTNPSIFSNPTATVNSFHVYNQGTTTGGVGVGEWLWIDGVNIPSQTDTAHFIDGNTYNFTTIVTPHSSQVNVGDHKTYQIMSAQEGQGGNLCGTTTFSFTAAVTPTPTPTYESVQRVTATSSTGNEICRGGYADGQCTALPFDTTNDLAFSGNGFAQPAVAFDDISGYPVIHEPQNVNDGYYGNGSSWISNSPDSWVKIDLGRIVTFDTLQFGRDSARGYDDRDPGQFQIAVANTDDVYANGNDSNDSTEYTTVYDSTPTGFDGMINGTERLKVHFTPVTARYVKLFVQNQGAAVDEIEVFNSTSLTPTPTPTPTDQAPVVAALPAIPMHVGDTYTLNSSFTDPDSVSWTGTVDYGDGSGNQPLGLNVTNYSLSHQYTTAGTYTITVHITDNQGQTGTATGTAVVLDPTQSNGGITYTPQNIMHFDNTYTTCSYGHQVLYVQNGTNTNPNSAHDYFNLSDHGITVPYDWDLSTVSNPLTLGNTYTAIEDCDGDQSQRHFLTFIYNAAPTPTPTLVTATDSGGNASGNFTADTNFTGGSTYVSSLPVDLSTVANPARQDVYQSVRYGNFSYTFPNLTPNASYTIRLHFNELYWGTSNSGSGGYGSRVFNVSINNTTALSNYDIFAKAGGADIATVEQIPTTSDQNGTITITFTSVTDNAMVNGIELYSGTLPSPSPTPTPTPVSNISMNVGGGSISNFVSDRNFTGGSTYTSSLPVDLSSLTNAAPQEVYQSVRYGNFSYTINHLLPNTTYHLQLDFNELYWGTTNSGNSGGAGSRVFNVVANNNPLLTNYDIFADAGGADKAIAKDFIVTTDANGVLTLVFTSIADTAMVNGIELSL